MDFEKIIEEAEANFLDESLPIEERKAYLELEIAVRRLESLRILNGLPNEMQILCGDCGFTYRVKLIHHAYAGSDADFCKKCHSQNLGRKLIV
jgi:hypothetical protein